MIRTLTRAALCTAALTVASAVASAVAWTAPAHAQAITTEAFVNGLTRPVYLTHAPGDFDRVFVVEQRSGSTGRIRVLDRDTGAILNTFLSVPGVSTSSEQGLLGLAFHPDYANNGYFYVNFTTNSGGNRTRVVRYQVQGDPMTSNTANASSATPVINIPQTSSNHNGGWIGFAPDGTLYVAMGDGGGACDTPENAQNLGLLLGKMLRIDVDGDDFPGDANANYAIPADNPFVGFGGVREEILHWGLRNPWRCAFDRVTGDLYIADVGQNAREEINFVPAGDLTAKNFGWDCREGTVCATASGCATDNTCGCGDASLVDPIQEYIYGGAPFRCSISGGKIYRGCFIDGLQGTYFYSDYCSGQTWSIRYDGTTVSEFQLRSEISGVSNITAFGEDAYGEIYIMGLSGGTIRRIVADNAQGFIGDDDNMNGIPDACEPTIQCPGDVNTTGTTNGVPDGVTNISDLQFFLNVWQNDLGNTPGSIADINTTGETSGNPDGVVNISDLQFYFNEWQAGLTACP